MLKKTTVMVDEEDLALIKAAAAREGRPESEIFREAFHIAALRTKRWSEDWDIPTLRSGRSWTHDDLKQIVQEEIIRRNT
ncbi:ribbon-helix-helix protein, CopG family [Nocardia brasiliensis]|uniref:Ribbon-helix-helix protein, CopG family n=1 Tax=Nocardia brasiliensis TaxID=37326 RepID=A0A6G9XWH4_NOCBR|nr:ribbon-helix-helix protein, CopG family [Nocardia brasiliensis]QIS05217.1 ribbon-helix-helix protein, CopG family [Nocardia brasiliensis]